MGSTTPARGPAEEPTRPTRPDDETLKLGPPAGSGRFSISSRFGKFEILGEIGRGGMGVVYKARQIDLDRIVALKVLVLGDHSDADEVRRFHREAKAAGGLRHPNLVGVHEAGQHEGFHYLTMDFIEGENLAKATRRERLPLKRALGLVQKIALGLHAAHKAGVVHRDVKPANILVDKRGEPVLTDFGLAKLGPQATRLTTSGTTLGTPAYMSPEQARGERDTVDARSDIYSLGAVLYELLSGRPPFEGASAIDTIHKVVYGEPPSLRLRNPALPREVEAICLKAMEREPGRRYASAAQFANDLARYLRGEETLARPPSTIGRVARVLRRRWPVFAVGAAAIALVALGFVLAGREPPPAATPNPAPPDDGAARAKALAAADPFYREAQDAFDKADRLLYVKGDVAARDMSAARRRAIDKAKEALQHCQDHVDARLLRGKALRLERRYAEALEDFGRLIADHPELATPYLERARVLVDQLEESVGGHLWRMNLRTVEFGARKSPTAEDADLRKRAADDLRAYQERAGGAGRDLIVRVLLAKTAGEYGQLLELLKDLRRDDVDASPLLYQRALAHAYLNRHADARADLDAVLAFQVNNANAHAWRGLIRRALGDLKGALEDADRVCALYPPSAANYNNRGMIKRALKDTKGAIDDYTLAHKLDPRMYNPLANRGMAYNDIREYEKALADFDAALKLDRTSAMTWGGRADALESLGRLDEALIDLNECIRLSPDLAIAYNNRGGVLLQLKRKDEALRDFQKAEELDPKYADPWANEGRLRVERGEIPEALRALDEALRLDPKCVLALVYRGRIHQQQGRLKEALEDYTRAIEVNPGFPDVYFGRGYVHAQMGDADAARADLKRYLKLAPNGYYKKQAEEVLQKLGER